MSNTEYSGTVTIAERLQYQRLLDMEKRYDILMPIDGDYDQAMCRDKFLHQLFEELNLENENEESSSALSIRSNYTYNRSVSISTFLKFAPKIIKKAQSLDNITVRDLEAHRYSLSVLSGQRDYRYSELLESIKRSSLFLMFARVIKRLRIMHSFSRDFSRINLNDLPNNLFKWSMDGLFDRCMLPDDVYIDVLCMNHTAEDLDWAKFGMDLIETLRYYKYFYMEIYHDHGYQKMLSILWDQQQFLHIEKKLDTTLKTTIKTLYDVDQQERSFENNWFALKKRNMVRNCQGRYMEATWRLPIEWRYVRDYYASLVEVQCLKDNMPVAKLEQQIEEQKELISKDNLATRNSICVYDFLIDKYQARLRNTSHSFSKDLENWELQIAIAKTRLTKTRNDYKEAEENIEYMRRRVVEVKELIEAERKAELDEFLKLQSIPQQKRKFTKARKTKINRNTTNRKTLFQNTSSNQLALNPAS